MKLLAQKTKLKPNDRIMKTDQFLELLKETERKNPETEKKEPETEKKEPKTEKDNKRKEPKAIILSPSEKSKLYGIEVKPLDKLFDAYYMEDTYLEAGNGIPVTSRDRQFPILEKMDMLSWLCFYEEKNYNVAEKFYNTLKLCSKSFNINIEEPEWIEMSNNAAPKDSLINTK